MDPFTFSLQYDSKSNCSKPVTDGIAEVQTSISGGEGRIIKRMEDGRGGGGRGGQWAGKAMPYSQSFETEQSYEVLFSC